MDPEVRRLLDEMAEALDAVLIALQVGDADPPGRDQSLREALRRVNRVRRSLLELAQDS